MLSELVAHCGSVVLELRRAFLSDYGSVIDQWQAVIDSHKMLAWSRDTLSKWLYECFTPFRPDTGGIDGASDL